MIYGLLGKRRKYVIQLSIGFTINYDFENGFRMGCGDFA